MRKGSGFTLIELLVVLAVLGVLMAVVPLAIDALTNVAGQRAMEAERRIVQTAIDAYLAHEGGALQAQAQPYRIPGGGDTVAPFGAYLLGETRYCYTWEEGGEGLEVHAACAEAAPSATPTPVPSPLVPTPTFTFTPAPTPTFTPTPRKTLPIIPPGWTIRPPEPPGPPWLPEPPGKPGR